MPLETIFLWCYLFVGLFAAVVAALAIRRSRRKKRDGLVDAILKIAKQMEK